MSIDWDFEDTEHQVVDGEEDEGVRRVQSRVLALSYRLNASNVRQSTSVTAGRSPFSSATAAVAQQDKGKASRLDLPYTLVLLTFCDLVCGVLDVLR